MASSTRLKIELDISVTEIVNIATAALQSNQSFEEFIMSAIAEKVWDTFVEKKDENE